MNMAPQRAAWPMGCIGDHGNGNQSFCAGLNKRNDDSKGAQMTARFSRRAVLAHIGLGGFAAATGTLSGKHAFAAMDDRPWYFLSNDQARWLAAICDVIIPEDDFPSASQAGVVDYIDFQLATDYGKGNGLYLEGPFPEGASPEQGWQIPYPPAQMITRAIDAHLAEGTAVFDLDPPARAAVVQMLSERGQPLGDIPAGDFFTELLSLTNEGYFADPMYLGNYDYAGWKMVGFPGAHAYYLDSVDDHNRRYDKPPMGIAHDPNGLSRPPRVIGREG
jgi:hypothetical protein